MKLAACVVSSDLTPLYLDFFPLVHRAWREVVGVRAVLVLVAHELPKELRSLASDILLLPPIPGVAAAFHAQCARLLAPQILRTPPDEAILISDVDMVPMDRDFYLDALAGVASTDFVIYRSHALAPSTREIILCYTAAVPRVWGEVFGTASTVADINRQICDWQRSTEAKSGIWSADQRLLFSGIGGFDPQRVRRLTDAETDFARLDRGGMGRGISPLQASLAKRRYYSDYHMKRPNSAFSELNTRIVEMAINGRRRRWPIDRLMYDVDRMLHRAFGFAKGDGGQRAG